MKTNITTVTVPSAYVTKMRQRIKQYNDTVYLKNGDEFEIELFNPTTNKVLAKIEINGNTIGGNGIVLRPGERVFLERYINEAKKFLFETYKVSGTNGDVQRAIANNGDIVIMFYQEYFAPVTTWSPSVSQTIWPNWHNGIYYYTTNTGSARTNLLNDLRGTLTNTSYSSTIGTTGVQGCAGTPTLDCCSFTTSTDAKFSDNLRKTKTLKKESLKEVETGRVEKGSNSDQSFTYDYTTFNTYCSWTTKWKILPVSQKETVIEDLAIFCTGCGTKRKKHSHLFCPICGTKY